MSPEVKGFLELGATAFLGYMLYLIWNAFVKLNEKLVTVVENNTRAVSKLESKDDELCRTLGEHDDKLDRVADVSELTNQTVRNVDVRTTRSEELLKRHHAAVSANAGEKQDITGVSNAQNS